MGSGLTSFDQETTTSQMTCCRRFQVKSADVERTMCDLAATWSDDVSWADVVIHAMKQSDTVKFRFHMARNGVNIDVCFFAAEFGQRNDAWYVICHCLRNEYLDEALSNTLEKSLPQDMVGVFTPVGFKPKWTATEARPQITTTKKSRTAGGLLESPPSTSMMRGVAPRRVEPTHSAPNQAGRTLQLGAAPRLESTATASNRGATLDPSLWCARASSLDSQKSLDMIRPHVPQPPLSLTCSVRVVQEDSVEGIRYFFHTVLPLCLSSTQITQDFEDELVRKIEQVQYERMEERVQIEELTQFGHNRLVAMIEADFQDDKWMIKFAYVKHACAEFSQAAVSAKLNEQLQSTRMDVPIGW